MNLFGIQILEPDVALTDFALTIECSIIIAWLLARTTGTQAALKKWYVLFFAAAAIAPLAGGAVHGFFPDKGTQPHDGLWTFTLAAIGLNTLACWNVSAAVLNWAQRPRRWMLGLSTAYFVLYLVYLLMGSRGFIVAVVGYLPAVLFLLYATVMCWLREKNGATLSGLLAIVLTLVAAAVQTMRIGLHPLYFNNNALYHLIQGIAFVLLARFARWTVSRNKENS